MYSELIITTKIFCSPLVLSRMETKCGVQLLHSKCYLFAKPGCSGTANNRESIDAHLNSIARKLVPFLHKTKSAEQTFQPAPLERANFHFYSQRSGD